MTTHLGGSAVPLSMSTSVDVVAINPSTWSDYFRFDQAQLRPGPSRLLTIAGQGDVGPDGSLVHPGDIAAQLAGAVAAVTELLTAGAMSWADVNRLVVYTTDLDGLLPVYHHLTDALDAVGARPPCTLLGVARLALPGMTVEVEATAGC